MSTDMNRARMRFKLAMKAYNDLLAETNQCWMESDSAQAKKLNAAVHRLAPAFKRTAKAVGLSVTMI